jgi:hypothetical protein
MSARTCLTVFSSTFNIASAKFGEIHGTIKRSWIVMNRFLEFKKRGDEALPLSDFPLLDQ